MSAVSAPSFGPARAQLPPVTPTWYPSGPSMDTLTYNIFSDQAAEFTAIQQPSPSIDLTDWPMPQTVLAGIQSNPNFYVTQPIAETGYHELEFHMAQNFWGCKFNFGNAICGTHIRQAFPHGMDKNMFVSNEFFGAARQIDNPVPPSVTLNSPNPCTWDPLFTQTGSNCIVNGGGGTAYHLAAANSDEYKECGY